MQSEPSKLYPQKVPFKNHSSNANSIKKLWGCYGKASRQISRPQPPSSASRPPEDSPESLVIPSLELLHAIGTIDILRRLFIGHQVYHLKI